MDIEIRRLTPDQAEAYVRFFDETPHDHGVDADKCYCVTWRGDASYTGDNDHWFPTREERRERALGFVRDGHIKGYLAYSNGDIVGWCNANPDCRGCLGYLRGFWPIEEHGDGVRVLPVFCFMIAPHAQRAGVATALLERVCADAADEGYDYIEAYTNEVHVPPDFRGPVGLYEACGFVECGKRDGRVVMRRGLKG